jgi:hypothetical protein
VSTLAEIPSVRFPQRYETETPHRGFLTRLQCGSGSFSRSRRFCFFSVWEINITPLLASAGVAGIAIALAAKGTLANFFGEVSVLLD